MDNKLPVVGKLYKIIKRTAFHNRENTWHPVYNEGIVLLVKFEKLSVLEYKFYYILFNGKSLYHTMNDSSKSFWSHFSEIEQ